MAALEPPLILVVVPVLGRPQNVVPLVNSWHNASVGKSRLLFVVTESDEAECEEVRRVGRRGPMVGRTVVRWSAGRGDFARKVNTAYRTTTDEYLFQAADDVRFKHGWETAVLEAATLTGCGVIGTNDLANPRVVSGEHSTHSLIARWYIDECGASWDGPGSVFAECYSHQYVDTELVELAKHRGCYAHAHGAVVEHLHPIWHTAPSDATYDKALGDARRDFELYTRREQEWQTS